MRAPFCSPSFHRMRARLRTTVKARCCMQNSITGEGSEGELLIYYHAGSFSPNTFHTQMDSCNTHTCKTRTCSLPPPHTGVEHSRTGQYLIHGQLCVRRSCFRAFRRMIKRRADIWGFAARTTSAAATNSFIAVTTDGDEENAASLSLSFSFFGDVIMTRGMRRKEEEEKEERWLRLRPKPLIACRL